MTAKYQVAEASGQYLAEVAGQTVPAGYKQTEVGVIPADWELRQLGKVFEFKNGLNKEKEYFGYGSPIINYMDVYRIVGITEKDVTGKVFVNPVEQKNYSAQKGDVFFTRTSETIEEIGLASVLLEEIQGAVFSGFLLRARQKVELFASIYAKYCFRSQLTRKQIQGTASYTTRALTNGSLLSNVLIPIPLLEEQTAIANALTDVDMLINELGKLIAKKQAIKTATMQQLLTGRIRLPPFVLREDGTQKGYKQSELGEIPENWEVITIDEALADKLLIDQMDGNHGELYPKSHEFSSFGVPYIGATDFDSGRVNYKTCKYLPIARAKKFKKGIAKDGDVLFAHNATVGPVALLQTELEFVILSTTATYYRCDPERLNNKYLAKFFESEFFVKQYSAVMSQSTRNQVPILAQRKFSIVLPSIKEQTAIATILSDMDADIQALQQRLSKTHQIKQGMMQELLTGKTRLVKPATRENANV